MANTYSKSMGNKVIIVGIDNIKIDEKNVQTKKPMGPSVKLSPQNPSIKSPYKIDSRLAASGTTSMNTSQKPASNLI